jgi:hypothetical protein
MMEIDALFFSFLFFSSACALQKWLSLVYSIAWVVRTLALCMPDGSAVRRWSLAATFIRRCQRA